MTPAEQKPFVICADSLIIRHEKKTEKKQVVPKSAGVLFTRSSPNGDIICARHNTTAPPDNTQLPLGSAWLRYRCVREKLAKVVSCGSPKSAAHDQKGGLDVWARLSLVFGLRKNKRWSSGTKGWGEERRGWCQTSLHTNELVGTRICWLQQPRAVGTNRVAVKSRLLRGYSSILRGWS